MFKSIKIAAALAATLALSPAGPATAASNGGACASASNVVARAGQEGIAALRARSRERFRAVFARHGDVGAMTRFALGRYARRMNAEQRAQYDHFAAARLIKTVRTRLADVDPVRLEVTGCALDRRIVATDLVIGNGSRYAVKWRLDRQNRIVDINVFGIWLAMHYRTEFAGIIAQGGGNVSALIRQLETGRMLVTSSR